MCSPPLPLSYLLSRHEEVEQDCTKTFPESFDGLQVTFIWSSFFIIIFLKENLNGYLAEGSPKIPEMNKKCKTHSPS